MAAVYWKFVIESTRLEYGFRQFFDAGERFTREDLSVLGRYHDYHVVVLGIGVLERLEGEQLGVVLAEEYAVTGIEVELRHPVTASKDPDQGEHDHQTPVRQDPFRKRSF